MYWKVGIDEAGYGPTLGPFVMVLTAVGIPSTHEPDEDCWSLLSPWIRTATGRVKHDDSRLIVGDSKKIHSMVDGRMILGTPWRTIFDLKIPEYVPIDRFLSIINCVGRKEIAQEFWWIGDELIHLKKQEIYPSVGEGASPVFKFGIVIKTVKEFNKICSESGSKGSITATAWKELVSSFFNCLAPGDTVHFLTDKHGGRNQYLGMIHEVFDKREWVVPVRETAAESFYQVQGSGMEIGFRFIPRAEAACPMVALASMLAKHLREETMRIFNKWWKIRIPELQPTAGYPVDARRYISVIQPFADQMGIAMEEIIRVK